MDCYVLLLTSCTQDIKSENSADDVIQVEILLQLGVK